MILSMILLDNMKKMVNVELRPHGIAPMNATSLFMVFWSSMLFPDSGGDAPVPSSMLFPDSGFEIAEEPLGRNPAWAQFQWNRKKYKLPWTQKHFSEGGGEEYFRANSQRLRFFCKL